jgi:glycosyltransferase involved in cell wall biosynthesis
MISCDAQACVSPLVRQREVENGRIPAERCVAIQNGIAPIQCETPASYAHEALGLPQNARICITVGRANPGKRIDFIIEIARRSIHELGMRDVFFVHCGDGPDRGRLEQLVNEAELDGRFILAGRRADVLQLLCSSEFAIHASKSEGFSLAVLEYMSAGLVVLVPNLPSVSQAITNGQTGLIYTEGDVAHASDLLAWMYSDNDARRRIGAAAAREVRERFSLERTNGEFSAFLERFVFVS